MVWASLQNRLGFRVIHLVTSRNGALYDNEIKSLHRVRKTVFVDELGWKLPVIDGMEYDEYDDDRASNVVGFSTEGEVVMGLRFRPTADRSMLADHFSHVLSPGARGINDEHTWELTRGFCIERGVRRHHLRRKAACMIAPLEIALAAGIDRCVGFTDVRMINFCQGVGWQMNMLSPAVAYGEGDAVAYEVDISRAAVDRMRRMWGLPEPAYVEIVELIDGESNIRDAEARLRDHNPRLADLAPSPDASALAGLPSGQPATADEHYASYVAARRPGE
jgi:N-acyl-L-homoserine lactone synthetase